MKNDELLVLTLKKNGKKVYVNPAYIHLIFQIDDEDGCVVTFGFGDCVEVLESADLVAKMTEW